MMRVILETHCVHSIRYLSIYSFFINLFYYLQVLSCIPNQLINSFISNISGLFICDCSSVFSNVDSNYSTQWETTSLNSIPKCTKGSSWP
jgi:hypothetical protein